MISLALRGCIIHVSFVEAVEVVPSLTGREMGECSGRRAIGDYGMNGYREPKPHPPQADIDIQSDKKKIISIFTCLMVKVEEAFS